MNGLVSLITANAPCMLPLPGKRATIMAMQAMVTGATTTLAVGYPGLKGPTWAMGSERCSIGTSSIENCARAQLRAIEIHRGAVGHERENSLVG